MPLTSTLIVFPLEFLDINIVLFCDNDFMIKLRICRLLFIDNSLHNVIVDYIVLKNPRSAKLIFFRHNGHFRSLQAARGRRNICGDNHLFSLVTRAKAL